MYVVSQNIPIFNNEVESIIKFFFCKESTELEVFSGNVYQIFRVDANYSQTLPKNQRWKNFSNLISWGQDHPDTKSEKDTTREQIYTPISLVNIDAKVLKNISKK